MRMIRNTQLVTIDAMLITIAPSIAQPSDSIERPAWVKPSMVKVSPPIRLDSQATKIRIAPLITNEIKPKVNR